MKVLYDTHVLLDVLLQREPFFEASSRLVGFAETSKIDGWICATTVTTIYYLLQKAYAASEAEEITKRMLNIFNIAAVTRLVLENALKNDFKDHEDSVLYESAVLSKVDVLITRNEKDFAKSKIPVFNPSDFLKTVQI